MTKDSTKATQKTDKKTKPAVKTSKAVQKPAKAQPKPAKAPAAKTQPAKTAPKAKGAAPAKAITPAKPQATEQSRKAIYRVAYDKEDRVWTIKKDGAARTIATFVTKDEAMKRVKELANNQDLNFVVRKKDGKFQKK